MFWLALGWIMLAPYLVGLAIVRFPRMRRLVARRLVVATALGWTAMIVLVAGVLIVGGKTGVEAALIAAPFGGLAFWVPSNGGQRDDGPPPEPEPEDAPPSGDTIDWDRFQREVDEWARSGSRARRQPPPRRVQPVPPRVRGGRAPSRTERRRS